MMSMVHFEANSSGLPVMALFGCYSVVFVEAEDFRESLSSPHARAMKGLQWYAC